MIQKNGHSGPRPWWFVALLSVAIVAGCAVNPVSGKKQLSLMSEQEEVSLGREADKDIRQEYGVYNDPALQAYVNEVGQRLARQSHRANLQWHFTVVDSPEINAFALPGGYVYITRGLMAYLDSEAELAGVLGHEIGHVTARHGAQQQTHGALAQGAAVLAEIIGQVGLGVRGAGDIVGSVGQGLIRSYGRDHEHEADRLGAEYLSRTGSDPRAMIKVIEVLKEQEQFAAEKAKREGRAAQRMPDWLSTHPSNEQRLRDINEFAARYPLNAKADSGRERYLRKLSGLTFGDSREQGLVRGQHFYHEPLGMAMTAPRGWRFQNSPESLMVVNGAGDAGVVLRPAGQGGSHEQIIRDVIKPRTGRIERSTINGLVATHLSGGVVNQQGQVVPVEVTVVTLGQNNFLLQQVFRDGNAYNRARDGIQSVLQSFRALSSADRQAAKPYQLRVLSLPAGKSLGALVQESPLPDFAEQQLRLLNGIYPSGELRPGGLVKVVGQ